MQELLSRPSTGLRRFPPIDSRLYTRSGHARSGPAAGPGAVLGLAGRPLRPWQRLGGIGLDPAGRLTRLVYLHRAAFTAELAGQARRAAAYWNELEHWLRAHVDDRACWSVLAGMLAVDGARPSPEAARQCLVDELLIDTHLAFVNGLAGVAPAAAHAARVAGLLEYSGLDEDARRELGGLQTRRPAKRLPAASWRSTAAFWLWSPRELRLKVQTVATVILALVATGMVVRDHRHRAHRDRAFAQLDAAARAGDDWSLMSAAESFLLDPRVRRDVRADSVRNAYDRALVRGVLQTAPNDPRLQPHLDAYLSLDDTHTGARP